MMSIRGHLDNFAIEPILPVGAGLRELAVQADGAISASKNPFADSSRRTKTTRSGDAPASAARRASSTMT
jgi:hypothetical protein